MKEMYPGKVRLISAMIEEECDKLEYADSPMLVEYPDPGFIRKMARNINDRLYIQDDIAAFDDSGFDGPGPGGPGAPGGPGGPGGPDGPYDNCPGCMLRNLIETLICNEFYCRRQRYRRCRRKFYL
jgi:hypothetical protein